MALQKEEIAAYLRNRLTVGEETLHAMIKNNNVPLPRRSVALVIDKYISDFKQGKSEPRWVAIPGLRGVGKTTMLAQLYTGLDCKKDHKIYISLDDAIRALGVNISDILTVYEELLGAPFQTLNEPVFIFLDEVQYDSSWGLTLKSLYDRAKNVFIICTGSSALSLQTNPDIARRVVITKIYPLTFTEYQMISKKRYPIKGLGHAIRETLFSGESAEGVYEVLKNHEPDVDRYWKFIDKTAIGNYLKYGTLPFAVSLRHEPLIYTQINQTLNSVLTRDVPQLNKFDKETLDKLSQILYMVASYDETSFTKIAENIKLDIKTVIAVFDALEKTELLIRIYPNGSHDSQVKKPSKFLFASPAFRAMYFNVIGSTTSFDNYKGKLFEDIIGLYLHRIFYMNSEMSITYDSAQHGADFIIGTRLSESEKIVLEASLQNKGTQQVINTMKKVKSKYGVVVSPGKLWLDDTKTCLSVPYQFFLLV